MQCIVSEVLCYTQNHFSGATRDNMVTALTGCYNEDEILIAKNLLFSVVDGMASKPDGLSRNIKRQGGENKKLQDCRDMLTLYRELDQAKAELPRFVAANLARIPTVKPGEVDIYYMAVTVANLSTQLEKVTARLAALENQKPSSPPFSSQDAAVSRSWPELPTPNPDSALGLQQTLAQPESGTGNWASIALNNAAEWKESDKRPARPPAPIRVKGSRNDVGEKLKTVPRKTVLAAYVGRLHVDTTPEDLSEFLVNEGMKGIVCQKLKAKEGRTFKTAAFYVTCSPESSDLFYDENCWPEGVELRDWVYYNNNRR